jgi:uncharacterized OB-fold protein
VSEETLDRPLPYPSHVSEPFWQACRRRELLVQRCGDCGSYVFYPRAICPSCGSPTLTWHPVSGRGTLFTFTVARRPTHRRLASRVPFVIAVVELEEGPRMTSSVVDCDVETLRIGQPVVVDFEDLGEAVVPVFRLAPQAHS